LKFESITESIESIDVLPPILLNTKGKESFKAGIPELSR